MITEERLKEILDRANDATPGPWVQGMHWCEGPNKLGHCYNEKAKLMTSCLVIITRIT